MAGRFTRHFIVFPAQLYLNSARRCIVLGNVAITRSRKEVPFLLPYFLQPLHQLSLLARTKLYHNVGEARNKTKPR